MLHHCYELRELPQGMGKLVNLRHLGIKYTSSLKFLPQGIGSMRSLRSLTKFIVGGGCDIGDLKNLNLHQRELEIEKLERVTNKDEAMEAELKNDEYLRHLRLSFEWNDSFETSEVERIEGVLEGLEPHGNLNELTIKSYIGSKFPRWMMNGTFLFNLRILIVDQCNCVQLPFLESLEILIRNRMPKVKRVGSEFLGIDSSDGVDMSISKLEILRFDTMDNLEEWDLNMKDVMPRLKDLFVHNCQKLKRIPALRNLEFLETLGISGIGGELLGISNGKDGGESIPTVVFPRLKKLYFMDLNEWEVWEMTTKKEITIMPYLVELEFYDCSKLKTLPECIMCSSTIRELTIWNYPKLWTLEKLPASSTLKILSMSCEDCVTLPQGLTQLKSLEKLSIYNSNCHAPKSTF
ncbi:hypothetical protein GIB67_014363 [Kingdonia uniflora]|uniref:Uncharacterized protein n=1 Tax=Kingdonia uniflora TaxID=39325 RepID=A0A7J7NTL6_9MAGN|nr:hypothetical protein GIB67_014363 [Kingdonia uniflora]